MCHIPHGGEEVPDTGTGATLQRWRDAATLSEPVRRGVALSGTSVGSQQAAAICNADTIPAKVGSARGHATESGLGQFR